MDERVKRVLGFFEPEVLAAYREQPDKFALTTDHFEGHLTISSDYYMRLDETGRDEEYIEVRFGYRTLRNGDLKLVVFLPDLVDRSRGHLGRWRAFAVGTDEWLDDDKDERFKLWVRRYMEGDWSVDNGPAFQLLEEVNLVNGITMEAAGQRLFNIDAPSVPYPAAQNTHRYEDAHRELYGVVIDGLDKAGIEHLGRRLGRPINAQSMKTRDALAQILPVVTNDSAFADPIENVSEQRRRATHKVRPRPHLCRRSSSLRRTCSIAIRLSFYCGPRSSRSFTWKQRRHRVGRKRSLIFRVSATLPNPITRSMARRTDGWQNHH